MAIADMTNEQILAFCSAKAQFWKGIRNRLELMMTHAEDLDIAPAKQLAFRTKLLQEVQNNEPRLIDFGGK